VKVAQFLGVNGLLQCDADPAVTHTRRARALSQALNPSATPVSATASNISR
jgi:hypothetical protein